MFRGSYFFCFTLITVLLLGLVFGGDDSRDDEIKESLFPQLKSTLFDIQTVKLESPDQTVTLKNSSGEWQISERWEYPAGQKLVHGFLRELADAEKLERKTRKPENFARLGVDEAATKVTLDSGVSFWLGDAASGGRAGRYIRIGDDEVWLVSASFPDLSTAPASWLADDIIDIDPNQLREITTLHHGESLHARLVDDDVTIEGIERDQLRYAGITDNLRRVLSSVRLIDIVPLDDFDFSQASTLTAVLADNTTIEVRLLSQDDKYWLSRSGGQWAYEITARTYESMTQTHADFMREADNPDGL